jgi:hypothetical protein
MIGINQVVPSNTATLTITAPTNSIYRCNFASASFSVTGASGTQSNPKYMVLVVSYESTTGKYLISASAFNN